MKEQTKQTKEEKDAYAKFEELARKLIKTPRHNHDKYKKRRETRKVKELCEA